jgi:hypothetical protein
MKYLDVNHIAQESSALPYAGELIAFLKDNAEFIEFSYHGLTHEYDNKPIEFFDIYTNSRVPCSIQRSHIRASFQIIESLSLPKPEIFVPPGHAWQLGVTDKILSEYGIRYLVSTPAFTFNEISYHWGDSLFLSFLPRTSVGIRHDDINLNEGIMRRTRVKSPILINADSVKRRICPRSIYYNLRYERRLVSPPIHSYMTHIGNFSNQAMRFWRQIFDFVLERDDIHLCRTSTEAESYYRALIGDPSSPTR